MRPRRPGFSEPELVFSNKSSTSTIGVFHALTPVTETANVKSARVALDLYGLSAATLRVGYQLCDDGLTWPPSTTTPNLYVLAAVSTESVSYGNAWEDISAILTKKYMRSGVWVYNSSGSLLEFALAAIRIELRAF